MKRSTLQNLGVVALALLVLAALVISRPWEDSDEQRPTLDPTSMRSAASRRSDASTSSRTPRTHHEDGLPGLPVSDLPSEARQIHHVLMRGGPFEHRKDGTIFGNREGLLPEKPRGYYREFTVETPGSRDRGARRLVVGGCGAQTSERRGQVWARRCSRENPIYWTDDHYRSFWRVDD